jgi:hypothetical protein
VELARRSGSYQRSGLTIAAASAVFAISYVAKLNGEDEHWQHAQSASCLQIYGVGEDGVTAFTQYGIETLKTDR